MKKYFDIVETAKFSHRIVVDIEDSQDEEFDEFADKLVESMGSMRDGTTDEIVSKFVGEFGGESVEFIEDSSPESEFEFF